MTQIIGGHNLGLQFGSYTILNRNDTTGKGTLGHGEQSLVNIANGNLLLQDRDAYLPSFGQDFDLVRTYNSRGTGSGWTFSTNVTLEAHQDSLAAGGNQTDYTITYGDGTAFDLNYDNNKKLWISSDGAGAFETLQALTKAASDGASYIVTRADQSQYRFDKNYNLLAIVDTNAVSTTFTYQGGKLTKVNDDTGHVITLNYAGLGTLANITDEAGVTLVQYGYASGRLTSVTDRDGHITTYHYNNNGLLDSITLPDKQVVNGVTQQFATRTVSFQYQSVSWDDHPHNITDFDKGNQWVLTQITDANGEVTSFEYDFKFATGLAPNDRDLAFKLNGARDFQGGTTRVVDALGNARAYSNAAEYKAWRTAHSYYQTYDAAAVASSPALQTQVKAIRNAQSVVYTYDPNGQITNVKDEFGFETTYTYDFSGNL